MRTWYMLTYPKHKVRGKTDPDASLFTSQRPQYGTFYGQDEKWKNSKIVQLNKNLH